ncbi:MULTISPECIES: hypothetical protein [unclassified Streptomyces]|uniref:hypothetical protein n=1 Tax=unclassified Streptomyces TaxID=2593676 RepID=UPI000F4DBB95|nr:MULTISPECIES: hypothetical protein [unclassified Streptomyces]MDH6455142.1 hypothetical protein [Streptomyces sp. SAI-119]MDH6494304.1 hypothetical protein [Streptomyces sp. SAI-149]QUC58534.1 hypothetical protein IOD14_17880 [Streptomyces sp. A2-16]
MNRSAGLLSALYLATSTGLAWTAVLALRDGPPWAVCLFAAASLVPVIAVVRESVLWDQRRALAEMRRRAVGAGAGAADDIVRAELDTACCERWWTSCGTDHDSTCPRRVPRSSAA